MVLCNSNNNNLTLLRHSQFPGVTQGAAVTKQDATRSGPGRGCVLAFLFPNPGLDRDSLMKAGSLRSPTRWWSPDSAATPSLWWSCTFWDSSGAVTAVCVCFHWMTAGFFYLQLNVEYFKSRRDWLITPIEKQQLPQGLLKQCDPLQFAGKRVAHIF